MREALIALLRSGSTWLLLTLSAGAWPESRTKYGLRSRVKSQGQGGVLVVTPARGKWATASETWAQQKFWAGHGGLLLAVCLQQT